MLRFGYDVPWLPCVLRKLHRCEPVCEKGQLHESHRVVLRQMELEMNGKNELEMEEKAKMGR